MWLNQLPMSAATFDAKTGHLLFANTFWQDSVDAPQTIEFLQKVVPTFESDREIYARFGLDAEQWIQWLNHELHHNLFTTIYSPKNQQFESALLIAQTVSPEIQSDDGVIMVMAVVGQKAFVDTQTSWNSSPADKSLPVSEYDVQENDFKVKEACFVHSPTKQDSKKFDSFGHFENLDNTFKEAERRVCDFNNAQTRYELAAEAANDGLWGLNVANRSLHLSGQGARLLGLGENAGDWPIDVWEEQILPNDFLQFQADITLHESGATDFFNNEHRITDNDGNIRWLHSRGRARTNHAGEVEQIVGSITDITDRKQFESDLEYRATHDQLTGLANRDLLFRLVDVAMKKAKKSKDSFFALMFLDFDRFKVINDSFGHDVGDLLLINIAKRFKQALRIADVAARLGGDEFAVLLTGVRTVEEVYAVAERVREVMSHAHELQGHQVKSTASIGVVTYNNCYYSADEMIRDADTAMYIAKQNGKDQYVFFDDKMYQDAKRRMEIERGLMHAVERREIVVYYQPIVGGEDGSLQGFEAMIRWRPKGGKSVSPADFLPIAEETGTIVEIGEYVLEHSCKQAMIWNRMRQEQGMPLITVNVNVSRRQLLMPNIIERFEKILQQTGCEPHWIIAEITESTLTDERFDILPTLARIRELGMGLALDDFGTGQSSLSRLHEYPVTSLKIDQSFTRLISEKNESQSVYMAISNAIVTLALNLQFKVVAEGVETPDQLAALQALGCDCLQGYLFSKPLSVEQATAYLTETEDLDGQAGLRVGAAA